MFSNLISVTLVRHFCIFVWIHLTLLGILDKCHNIYQCWNCTVITRLLYNAFDTFAMPCCYSHANKSHCCRCCCRLQDLRSLPELFLILFDSFPLCILHFFYYFILFYCVMFFDMQTFSLLCILLQGLIFYSFPFSFSFLCCSVACWWIWVSNKSL